MDWDSDRVQKVAEVFKALSDPARLRLLGLIAERPRTGKELAQAVEISPSTVSHHMDRLLRSGLVRVDRRGQSRHYSLDVSGLRDLVGGDTRPEMAIGAESDAGARERAKTLRDFFDGERLRQIPAQRKKRVVVLQHLLSRFDPERAYQEREVNEVLKGAHDDLATLRRELVDYGFMTRAGGIYRVARALPARSPQVGQEIIGDETAWLRNLLSAAVSRPS